MGAAGTARWPHARANPPVSTRGTYTRLAQEVVGVHRAGEQGTERGGKAEARQGAQERAHAGQVRVDERTNERAASFRKAVEVQPTQVSDAPVHHWVSLTRRASARSLARWVLSGRHCPDVPWRTGKFPLKNPLSNHPRSADAAKGPCVFPSGSWYCHCAPAFASLSTLTTDRPLRPTEIFSPPSASASIGAGLAFSPFALALRLSLPSFAAPAPAFACAHVPLPLAPAPPRPPAADARSLALDPTSPTSPLFRRPIPSPDPRPLDVPDATTAGVTTTVLR